MILALVLILVVINAASRKEFYEPFFQASAVGSSAVGSDHEPTSPLSNSSPGELDITEADRQRAFEAASRLSAQEQVQKARSLLGLDQAQRDDLLIEAIIAEAEKRVVDGTVWRSSDRDALRLRLLQAGQSEQLHGEAPAIVGVLSLLQQPDAFRGQRVRMEGRIARLQRISEGSDHDDPLPDYWQLWIRPSGGTDRPLIALVTSIPDSLADFTEGEGSKNDPYVMVQGTFFKRLAYRSSLGADLAPVVIGRLWQPQPPAAVADSEPQDASSNSIAVLAIVGSSIGLGVLVAALVMWRTATSAKHTRQIRQESEATSLDLPVGFDEEPSNPNHD
jgi:hypothetical protein